MKIGEANMFVPIKMFHLTTKCMSRRPIQTYRHILKSLNLEPLQTCGNKQAFQSGSIFITEMTKRFPSPKGKSLFLSFSLNCHSQAESKIKNERNCL